MSRSRRPSVSVAYLLLVTVLGVIAALGTAGRASAATETFFAQSVGSPVTNRGDLTVQLYSTAPVTAVTARLTPVGAPADVLTVPLVNSGGSTPSGNDILSGWTVATPISTSQLPLGDYAVSLDGTFQDSSTHTEPSAGMLYFLNEPQVTLTADHTGVGYDYSPSVNLTGHVTILAPDGTTAPYPNGTVQLGNSGGTALPATSVTTDASGGFTAQATATGNGWIQATVNGSGNLDTQRSAAVTFTNVIDPVKLTNVRLAAQTVRYGTSDTILGTLSYLPEDTGTSYLPLPGRRVKVFSSEYPGKVVATGLTNASGQFSVKLPTWNIVGSSWTVVAGGTAGDPLFGPASAGGVPMKVQVRTAITSFHVSLSQYWQLSYSGCLNLPSSVPAATIRNTANLVFQYSSGGTNGPWHNLRWRPPVTRTCGNGGVWFSGTATAPRNLAYYRVYYYGSTVNGTIHLAAGSAKVIAWKYADRIVNFSASPHVVARNGKLTVRGQLEYYATSRWHVYGGQVVYIIFRQQGTSTWYWITRVKTNSTGHFAATVRDSVGSATWSAEFEGNSTHLATGPAGVYVRVTG